MKPPVVASVRRAARARDWGTIALWTTGICFAAFLCWYTVGSPSSQLRTLVTDVAYLPINGLAVVLGVRVTRRPGLDARTRRAWWLLTASFGCQFGANTAWLWSELVQHSHRYPSIADIGYLGFIPFMLAGLLTLPVGTRKVRQRARFALDILIVAVSGSMIIWYLALGPALATGGESPLAVAVSVGYPVGDLVLLFGISALLLRGVNAAGRRPLQILAAGLVLFVVADLCYGYAELHDDFVGGAWPDLGWLTASLLFALSAHDRYRRAADRGLAAGRPAGSRLPYIAVALAYGLLLVLARDVHLYPLGGMIVGAAALTMVVVLRQLNALHENRTLTVTDSLTGLANRTLVQQRLDSALAQARRTGRPVGVLVIDLDRFSAVNDTLGHEAGDTVLAGVGHALRTSVRSADLAGRLGGDQFAAVVDDLADVGAATGVARRVLEGLGTPVVFDGHVLDITASIGIAISEPGVTAGGLLRQAETAMYAAKKRGPGRYELYTADLDTDARQSELRRALEGDELVVYYQPIIDLETRAPLGVEALVRWQHPTRGLVAPGEFVPLAEETGLIVAMGAWILRRACEQVQQWSQQHPATHALTLSVNVAARQLRHPSVVSEVTGILRETGFDPRRLVLELTEGTLLHDDVPTLAKIEALRGLGVRVAVDDFGTGYSTLSYLRRLPIDILKIDKSFVDDIADDGGSATIGQAVVGLGRALGLDVVAEGIETAGQLDALRRMRCRQGQGFHFARPLPAAEALRVCIGDSLRYPAGDADCQTSKDG